MGNLLLLGATLIIAVIGVGTVKTIKAAAKYGKKGVAKLKLGDVLMKIGAKLFTGFFGKLLIPVGFIIYHYYNNFAPAENFWWQSLALGMIAVGTRFNFYGKRLHLIKSKNNPLGNPRTKTANNVTKTTNNSVNQLQR